MYWFLIAAICLLTGVGFLIRCAVCRKKSTQLASPKEEAPAAAENAAEVTVVVGESTEKNEAYVQKTKRALILGILFLVLTEVCILIANHVTI